jgi:hypothetical protein
MIAHNRFAVADTAIVEVGCYCGEGDPCKYYWDLGYPITLTIMLALSDSIQDL